MNDPDTPFLRPAFTQMLAKRLAGGGCINLIGPHGQGRRRTLKDLRLCLTSSLRVLQANLRDAPRDAGALLESLGQQAAFDTVGRLGTLLDELERRPTASLLILHNFDELHPGTESGYDEHFFAQLNSASNRSNISVLCISEHPHPDRPLQLEELTLPPLSLKQAIAELHRRGIPATERPRIAEQLLQQSSPYTAFDTLTFPDPHAIKR